MKTSCFNILKYDTIKKKEFMLSILFLCLKRWDEQSINENSFPLNDLQEYIYLSWANYIIFWFSKDRMAH